MAESNVHTIGELAGILSTEFVGEPSYLIEGLASLEKAGAKEVSFLASEKHLDNARTSKAGAIVLKPEWADSFEGNKILAADPYLAFAKLSKIFDSRAKRPSGVHPSAVVSEKAQVADSASIGANCVIGDDVIIGENTELYPGVIISENVSIGSECLVYSNVTIYSQVNIGSRVILHSGAVIGSDGFGFAPTKEGWVKIHQLGGVVIGNDVEIGASTAIDRGALEDTIIEDGVIIDNLVHIAHNVKIGERSAIAGCVGIAGSATLGKNCIVAGMVAINGHIDVADGTQFHGGTIVTKGNSEPGVFASAPPLQNVAKWRRNSVRYTQLDEYAAKIRKLEKHVFKE